jgi:diguanylate cyclase (GGDEF)-like protein/PAS domain S-box-containing protein
MRLAGCAFSVGVATIFVGLAPEANLIWVANGVLLAYLLLAPRKRWPAYLAAGFVAQFAAGLYAGHHGIVSGILLTFLNVSESLISALLLRRRSSQLPDFTNPAYITRFVAFGVFAGPVAMGAADSLLSPLWHTASPLWHSPSPGVEFVQWVAADALGACVAIPACVAIFRTRFRQSLFSFRHWAFILPAVLCALAAFCQDHLRMAFLIYPLLVLVLLRLGLGWASLATLLVATVGSFFTVRGQGPFAPSATVTPFASSIALQLFIASAMVILYGISVVLETLRATERKLKQTVAIHQLVVDNSRDVIILADFDGHRSFISAAGTNWGGWSREQLKATKSIDLVHSEDRPAVQAVLRELLSGKDGALIECRARRSDNSYIWVESSLHTIRDPITGVPTGILNSVREITKRKIAEQQLADAYHAVEALAITDPLTGLANRRRFDQCLITEWRRGMRDHKPISLLLIDADLFKSYNDTYGHLRGDGCLKQIAEAAQDVVARPGDLVARFGGEEFAIILPNTCNSGALQLAQDICAVMRNREFAHSANPAGIVTVSIGCATLVPQLGQHAATLIDCADQALYQAKNAGRNRALSYRPVANMANEARKPGSLISFKSA